MDQGSALEDRIERRLGSMVRASEQTFGQAHMELAGRGLGNSGAMLRRRLELLSQILVEGTDWAFGEIEDLCRRRRVARNVHAHFLEQALGRFFYDLVDKSKLLTTPTPDAALAHVQREIEITKQALAADLREYQQGVWAPRKPAGLPEGSAQNVLHVGGDFHGAVQQGGIGNIQVAVEVNWPQVAAVAGELDFELSRSGFAAEVKEALQPDLDTIKAQLRKPSPGQAIVREAAKSMRNIAEGAIAGALVTAPHIVPIIDQLLKAVGAA